MPPWSLNATVRRVREDELSSFRAIGMTLLQPMTRVLGLRPRMMPIHRGFERAVRSPRVLCSSVDLLAVAEVAGYRERPKENLAFFALAIVQSLALA